jgi:glucokinase
MKMKSGPCSIGIDIGGTKVNIGIVDSVGRVVAKCRVPTEKSQDAGDFIGIISGGVRRLLEENRFDLEEISFLGAGVPGTVDSATGHVHYCPNLRWNNVPAGSYFRKSLGRDVTMVQDCRAAALAELLYGAGRGCSDLLCVTLGTGIGGGLIIDGKIFHGSMNTAGEIGHTVVVKNGRLCSCGNHGCLERYFSGSGIIEQALEKFPHKFTEGNRSSEHVFELAKNGDLEARQLISESVEYLAIGIANVVSMFAPQAVIVSGGMCVHDDLIIDPLKVLVPRFGYVSWVSKNTLRIEKAMLGSDAPMIGAASLNRGA